MKKVLQELIDGKLSVDEAEKMLKTMQIVELEDFAKLDTARDVRTGFPEAIYAEGKADPELLKIINNCAKRGRVMVTRLEEKRYLKLKDKLFLNDESLMVEYNPKARILLIKDGEIEKKGKMGIITAGTSDVPVAEEARMVAEEAGCEVLTSYDVGVAGIHRLFSQIRRMLESDVKAIIVVAGMEGALPSVVAGLVDVPVIGVPTSVGYGVGAGGFAALNSMLQSCAPGIAVVNIDNGFGAAVFAASVVKQTIND